jgi:elongation factor P
MQTILPSEFKRGLVLLVDGAPWMIEDIHHSGTAQTKHKSHARLRQLKSGHLIDRVFAENERVPIVQMQNRRVTYSYTQGDRLVFLDALTYEEFDLGIEQFGARREFLKENEEYSAMLLDGALIDIVLPSQVPLKVVETAPPIRGGSDSAWKEAKLETGLQIMVPLFIAKGETVRVDTVTKKYAGKENLER